MLGENEMRIANMIKKSRILHLLVSLTLLLFGATCFANNIIISPNTVISHSKTYSNATLDMTNGSFIVRKNATLTINNCTVTGTISKKNPFLMTVIRGSLVLNNNTVNVQAVGIKPHDTTQSLYHVIQIETGNLTMDGNTIQIDKPFTAGLLMTDPIIQTKNFNITNNRFNHFHGVLYLMNADNALISGNTFYKNTYGNIVIFGTRSNIMGNAIYFSGNNRLGNAMDVIDSDNINIQNNLLFTPTCHGIYVLNSNNVLIDHNRVTGDITYAITLLTYPEISMADKEVAQLFAHHQMRNSLSTNITITNNFMSQNRFGIAATDVNTLSVQNNTFVQRFEDSDSRKFWTDNNILLRNVSNLSWSNNWYKEGYTQDMNGDNSQSNKLIPFPVTGGITL